MVKSSIIKIQIISNIPQLSFIATFSLIFNIRKKSCISIIIVILYIIRTHTTVIHFAAEFKKYSQTSIHVPFSITELIYSIEALRKLKQREEMSTFSMWNNYSVNVYITTLAE